MRRRPSAFFSRNHNGHLDFPRARAGGMAGGFFAVFVMGPKPANRARPYSPLDPAVAKRETLAMAGLLYQWVAASRGRFRVVTSTQTLRKNLSKGVMSAILHFEGAEAIDPELHLLEVWYRAGLRSLGITWSRPNVFGHGVPFKFPGSPNQGPGLTSAGKQLVRACNRLGILVDLSHLNEKGFWDVAKISKHPLVATHSASHVLCPSPRNLTDGQLKAIQQSNGVVGVVYYPGFLREDGKGSARTPIEEIAKHVEYIATRIGINHVALGSDFDGAAMPRAMKDASGLPKLVNALRQRGFGKKDLEKIAHANWLRVLSATWKN